jgi:hypothetical protein
MEQLNLGLEEPVKVEPKENLLQKAGGYLKKTFWDDPNARQEEIYQQAKAEGGGDPIKRILSHAKLFGVDKLKDFAAQAYSAGNEASMGAYDAIIKALSGATKSTAYDKLKAFKEKHKAASTVGGLQGAIAGMVAPSGGLLKAASGGAKALKAGKLASGLAKAADIASGAAKVGKGANLLSRAGGAALRGGLAGAEQAIPRGIIQAIGTGDIGKAAKGAALGTALGAGLGGGLQVVGEGIKGLGGLASRFAQSQNLMRKSGDIVQPIEKKLLEARLKGRFPELSTQNLTKAARSYSRKIGVDPVGYAINQGDEMKEAMLRLSDKYGVRNTDDLKDLIQGTGKAFEKAYEKTAAAGITPATILAPSLGEGGELAEFAAKYGDDAGDIIKTVVKEVGEAPDLRTAKAQIDRLVKFFRGSPKHQSTLAGADAPGLLYSLKDKLDDAVMSFDPGLASAKEDWAALAPLRQMVAKDELGLASLFSGSPTFEKGAAEKLINAGLTGGSIAGGPAALAAAGLGQSVSKAIPKALTFARGEIAEALSKPQALAMLKKGIAGVKGIAGGIGKIAGELPALAPKVAGAAPSILERAAESEPAVKEAITGEPAEEAQAAKESAQASEAAAEPEAVEAAKDEVKTAWADKVESNIQTAFYQYGVADMGYSYEDFLEAVREGTNNFDPTIAAEIVFDDEKERAAFLKDYDKALQYKSIDVGGALEPSAGGFMGILGPSKDQKSARIQLTDYIARVAGEDPMLMDAKKKKKISDTVKQISGMKGTASDKQSALLRELQANYGVDYARLADLGLLGVV